MADTNDKKIAIYAGSFDPITLGHLDILKEGSDLFDKVIVLIADNPSKKSMFTVEKKKELINKCISNMGNVEVDSYDGLTVEYASKHGADILLRGIRTVQDFEYEKELAECNKALAPEIKTVFLSAKPEHSFISSSAVREILAHNGDISGFVPQEIIKSLMRIHIM